MASLEIKKSDIPLWSGTNGSLLLDINADPTAPVTVGAAPIVNASFNVDGNADISFAQTGSVGIGIQSGARARIVPIFLENAGGGADLVDRFSLKNSLKTDNLLLALEVGGSANLTADGAFTYAVLSANATLKAGADATYVVVRSFPRTQALRPMLLDLLGNLSLPGNIKKPPALGDLVSFEFGGMLNFSVGASAGYEIKGTNSLKVSELLLSEHYALSVIGKLSFTGQIAGRFSVDVSAGSAPGFAHVVVRRRREKELQFAADVSVKADLNTQGLPGSGKEFLGALLGVQAKNWLGLLDRLVSEAGQVDSIDNLKARLDALATDYLSAFAGKAIDQITSVPEITEFQEKLGKVADSYRHLDDSAIALFDRYFDPVLSRVDELTSKLDELKSLVSFDQLKGEIDPVLWNVLRQLTDGDPLGWALGVIPGTTIPSLPKLKQRIEDTLSLIKDKAHEEIRNFIALAKQQFKLDTFFDQMALISSPGALKALASQKLGHFVQRVIGDALDQLNGKALKKAFGVVQDVVKARDTFFAKFDDILKEAAAQSFTLDLHAAYNSSSEREALIDMEIKLLESDKTPNLAGQHFMELVGRGDFQAVLANFQPSVVKLNNGLLTHKVASGTSFMFNVAGWHHDFHYESMHQVIVQTQQQIRDSGGGILTVFTNIDMTAASEKRKRGSKSEEAVLTNFLLRFLAESKVSDSNFDKDTQQYAIDIITGMSASYSVTFTDTDTSSAELDDYLRFARQLDLDKVGASREALAPVLEFKNGSFGKIESDYEVRYTEAGLKRLIAARPAASDIKRVLRSIALANYFGDPSLHDVGWLYSSDDVRNLFEQSGPNFIDAGSILDNARVRFTSPIPGILPPTRFTNNFQIRADVATLFNIEDSILRAFGSLTSLLSSSGPIPTSELEGKLKSFGAALNSFDGFDIGENSVFAVFDGLVLFSTSAAEARSSSLTFTSSKDGAEHTKVFTSPALAGRSG